MKIVEGEFEHLDFHDTDVKGIYIDSDKIQIDLSFAHILGNHSQNLLKAIICAKDCQLIFADVEEFIVKVHLDEQKGWEIVSSPQKKDYLGDIVESQITDDGYYKLSGMTIGSEWSDWLIKAKKVMLRWEREGKSWLTKD
jgi:hypothetical protein